MARFSLHHLQGPANTWYLRAADALIHDGAPVVSRGRAVHEALHTVLRMDDPRQRVLTVRGRRANPFFQMAETIWILAGRADAQWITGFNRQLSQFLDQAADRPGYFHGAYGERLRRWGHISKMETSGFQEMDQLRAIIDQLSKDPGSRRAVAVLHNPHVDNPWTPTNDRPCNIAFSAQQRDGRLHLAVFNRSNDLTLGLAYTNIVQFTTIQEFLAAALGLEVGTYTHVSSSLHVYDDDAIARRCLGSIRRPAFNVYDHVKPTAMLPWSATLEGFDTMLKLTAKPVSLAVLPCPYWETARQMLQVWAQLREHATSTSAAVLLPVLESVVPALCALPAQDWAVACLEYVYRWAANRMVDGNFRVVLERAHWPEPVVTFITHDQALDAATHAPV
jgi:thymidylate synthase